MYLVVKGSCPSEEIKDRDLLNEIDSEIVSSVVDQDFETKRIGKMHESNGRQLLLIQFKDAMKRKEFLRNSINLKVSSKYHYIFVDPSLIKSEREAQYQLRVEKRSLKKKYSDKKNHYQNWPTYGIEVSKFAYLILRITRNKLLASQCPEYSYERAQTEPLWADSTTNACCNWYC